MKSPFDELQIDPALVCEFFAIFARFEYAMKATRYCRADRHGNAIPDWKALKETLGSAICASLSEPLEELVQYLLSNPPEVQKLEEGSPRFRPVPLNGDNPGERAIEGAKRVRNNLFHGGKHTGHSPPERDTRLIDAAIVIIGACLEVDANLRFEFEHQLV